jgi:hypothetical protein
MIKSDAVVAWLRTAVPVGWGMLITFLLSRFPAVHELLSGPAVTALVTGLVVAVWYSLWKWLEPRLPAPLRTFLLGYDRPPVYFPGEIYENGYQAGQDDAVEAAQVSMAGRLGVVGDVPPEVLEEFKRSWEEHRQADPPRSIARPGESSGPRAFTDVMPAVDDGPPADQESGEGEHRG